MAGRSVLCCEELINFTAGGFALKQALTWPPLENTTFPGFTLSPEQSLRVHQAPPLCVINILTGVV